MYDLIKGIKKIFLGVISSVKWIVVLLPLFKKAPFEQVQFVRTAQKGLYVGKYKVLSGEASHKRRLSSF